MSVRVPINGDTLRWARTLSQLDPDEVGRAAGISAERIVDFEQGTAEPTYVQMRNISRRLDRPLAFFFAPAPREIDVPQTADFRGRQDAVVPSDLTREVKRADAHRATMLDLLDAAPQFPSLGSIEWKNVQQRAEEFRTILGLNESFTPPETQKDGAFKFWRGLLEHHGYLVFQTTGVALETFRALSIHHETLPIIILNGADAANARTFSLFHEVAHLANRTNGLCVMNDRVQEEAKCNAFAADALMPKTAVRALLRSVSEDDRIFAIAKRFKVSELAAAVRLKTLGLIDDRGLQEVRERSDAIWGSYRQRQKEKPGFVPAWQLRYRDLGNAYLGTVFRAVEEDRLSDLDATYLLNARLPMLEQMRAEFNRTGGQ